MSKPKIVRLFGKADNFDIELSRCPDGWWDCKIQSDPTDGQYAVALCAVNEYGERSYWTGELFMCNGICHFKLRESKYKMRVKPDMYKIHIKPERYNIQIRKGCPHGLCK